MAGKFYIVSTPIGNLGDITLRALETLKNVDVVAAEDTRHTRKLLNYYQIDTPLISYYEHKRREKGELVLQKLLAGQNVALVSDAGTPGISDPGEDLVRLCIENGVELTVLPGAAAFTAGLVMSGLPSSKFCFEGFLSARKGGRRERLEQIKCEDRTIIFYEAPHKLLRTLSDMRDILGDRNIAVCREITKLHEQVIRGGINAILEHFTQNEPRGEFVIVVEGHVPQPDERQFESAPAEDVQALIDSGVDKKEAIRIVAKERGVPKRDVYNEYSR